MKTFIINIIRFTIIIITSFAVIYYTVNRIINEKSADNSIFIWGDSQAYQGLNLELMSELTGKKVYSAAKHGAGIYDFLVFTEKVPKESIVIVAISKPVQLRRKSKDRNTSGILIWALNALAENNYSSVEVNDILYKNIALPIIFTSKNNLYPYADSIVLEEPISLFESIYSKKPSYLDDKKALYVLGIKKLIEKRCELTFIDFPYHSILNSIETKSTVREFTEKFKMEVYSLFNDAKIDSIFLDNSKTLMHDLTHLNVLGANKLTEEIVRKMKFQKQPTMYIVNGGLCN